MRQLTMLRRFKGHSSSRDILVWGHPQKTHEIKQLWGTKLQIEYFEPHNIHGYRLVALSWEQTLF